MTENFHWALILTFPELAWIVSGNTISPRLTALRILAATSFPRSLSTVSRCCWFFPLAFLFLRFLLGCVVDLQCCLCFCCAAPWICYTTGLLFELILLISKSISSTWIILKGLISSVPPSSLPFSSLPHAAAPGFQLHDQCQWIWTWPWYEKIFISRAPCLKWGLRPPASQRLLGRVISLCN